MVCLFFVLLNQNTVRKPRAECTYTYGCMCAQMHVRMCLLCLFSPDCCNHAHYKHINYHAVCGNDCTFLDDEHLIVRARTRLQHTTHTRSRNVWVGGVGEYGWVCVCMCVMRRCVCSCAARVIVHVRMCTAEGICSTMQLHTHTQQLSMRIRAFVHASRYSTRTRLINGFLIYHLPHMWVRCVCRSRKRERNKVCTICYVTRTRTIIWDALVGRRYMFCGRLRAPCNYHTKAHNVCICRARTRYRRYVISFAFTIVLCAERWRSQRRTHLARGLIDDRIFLRLFSISLSGCAYNRFTLQGVPGVVSVCACLLMFARARVW